MSRILPIVGLSATSCVWIFQGGEVEDYMSGESYPSIVESPIKAFLVDGSVAVFPAGARIGDGMIEGAGQRYSLGLTDTVVVQHLALDSVFGIEAFQGRVDTGKSAAISFLATGGLAVATPFIWAAIFGSCPTIYAPGPDGLELQAEAFSYSIAPLLEARDVDRLDVTPEADGRIRLELRNEALETHYINHLELLAVPHGPAVHVVPDEAGLPVGTAGRTPPVRARDRDGRSVLTDVAARDGVVFSSSGSRIAAASTSDWRDYVELAFPVPSEAGTMVAVLALRNSLLNTVLFYDLMLADAGAEALDWLGRSLERIDGVVELGSWFHETMGLRVEVYDGAEWKEVARVGDSGPIAWSEVGVRVPVLQPDSIRMRLAFLTDGWRIDSVELAEESDIGRSVSMPVSRVSNLHGESWSEGPGRLALPDDDYVVTHPGEAAVLEFEASATEQAEAVTYFLSTQGYYTEWIRPAWIDDAAKDGTTFAPGPGVIEDLMGRWSDQRAYYERAFFESRIPVRGS